MSIDLLEPVLVMVGVAVMLVFALATRLRKHRSTDETKDQPRCVACGYPTVGISKLNCPECGADLREVGIETAAMRRRSVSEVVEAVWFVGLMVICFGVSVLVIEPSLPFTNSLSHYGSVVGFQGPGLAEIKLEHDLTTVYWRGTSGSGWKVKNLLRMRVYAVQPPPILIEIDGRSDRYTVTRPGQPPKTYSGEVTLSAVESWLQTVGLNPADDSVHLCAQSILSGIDSVLKTGWTDNPFYPVGQSTGGSINSSSDLIPGAGLIHFLWWTLACVIWYRMWKRRMGRA